MSEAPDDRRRSRPLTVSLTIVAIAVAVSAAVMLTHSGGPGGLLASAGASPTPPPPATRLLSVPSSQIADGTQPLHVTLSAPPAQDSPRPTLLPAVAGSWSTVGDTEVFTPASTLLPCTTYSLTVWKHTHAKEHSGLAARHVLQLHVACPSITALQEALARQGYLGAKLRPRYAVHLSTGPESLGEAAEHAFHPFHGRLVPDPADAPPVEMGQLDETTKGALEVFQADHNLEATGEPSARTWQLLLEVEALGHRNPRPYTWVSVSEAEPETLEVHEGNQVVISSPTNTGVAGAETAQGIFPIYARYESTTMEGTDPDGYHYVAPDVPWVNYFNGGDAVHGYPRASYGFPQSNGCVELPIETAAAVYPKLQIGDIVWVT
jgi:peptidoglycan hydrolase-like protein with peptidoglycan-binding domain